MKTLTIVILSLAIGFGGALLLLGTGGTDTAVAGEAEPGEQLYTCGMHPEIVTNEPGLCPICNMKLTPKKEGAEPASGITIDPVTRQNIGLATTNVHRDVLTRSVRSTGEIAVPEPNIHSVNVKVKGWIERLFVNEEGERVFAGQPLMEIYSPELVAAQREYLIALANQPQAIHASADHRGGFKTLLETSRRRLQNWDISEDQLQRLAESGKVQRTMRIRTPANGFIRRKMVEVGDQVSPGRSLFEIADLSTVWVEAFVYEQDLPFVEVGHDAVVTVPSLPGEVFRSRVVYVSPILNRRGQAEIRLRIDNPQHKLRPEMYAEVLIESRLPGRQPVVPRSAVINTGARKIVFVAGGEGTYQPREITTGAVGQGDMIQVTGGLRAGEEIVTSGQFLLDSESRLSEVLAAGGQAGHQHGAMATGEDHEQHQASGKQDSQAGHDHQEGVSDMSETETRPEDPYDIHTCPMPEHFHVLNYGPGDCPECGMALVPVSETENDSVWVCPMPECGTVQDKPGVCPVCNMNLIEYQSGESHDH